MILIYFLSLFSMMVGEEWTREIGVGDGGVVHRDGVLYVASSDLPNQISLLAIDASNGQLNWRQDFVQEANTRQEVSAEYPVRPLAPPVLGTASGVTAVAFMDFGGKLRVVSTERGKLLWESDLVKQFDATPVQYGFASSGITMGSQLIVPVGGPQTSVVAFRLNDGAIEWKSGPAEIGYASPIELKRNSQIEVIVALKDLLRSIEPATGKTLWEWKYPNQGLTNAPTPLVIGKSQLLVAGQGCDGTRLLDVSSGSNGVNPTERWHSSRHKPFYCNSAIVDQKLIGFAGSTANCVDLENGKILWQKRGFTDANVVHVNGEIIFVRGDGQLSRCKATDEGLTVLSQRDVTFDRYWAPPLLLDNGLILRGRSQLIRVELSSLLPEGESKRSDIELTSMEAMYGEVPPATKRLLAELNAKSDVENVEAYKVYRDRNPQLLKKKFLSRILSEARKANLVETIRLIEADLNE